MKKNKSPLVDAAPEQGASGERCSVAVGSAKLTAAQKSLLATMTHEWVRVSPHTKAGTLLSLRDKGIIEGRGNPSYGLACMEMQYNSAAWQWRIKPNKAICPPATHEPS